MKTDGRNLLVLIALLILVNACEETIEFKGNETEAKVVIYSLFEAGKDINISLTKSYTVFDLSFKPAPIANATVKLYSDGDYITTLTLEIDSSLDNDSPLQPFSNYIASGVTPEPGKLYRIEVSVPGLPDAWAEVSLPPIVAIEYIDTVLEPITHSSPNVIKANVGFTDPPGTENYYRVAVRYTDGRYYKEFNQVVVRSGLYPGATRNDPLINPRRGTLFGPEPSNLLSIFSDELISGKYYELKLTLDFSHRDTTHNDFQHFEVNLQSISKDLYLYLLTSEVQNKSKDNPHSEPVIVYSNIHNGLGVVGALSSSQSIIKYGHYPVAGVQYRYIDN